MRKIHEIFRLLWQLGLGVRKTARSCQISHATVVDYRHRAEEAGLDWPQVETMDAADLERRLFPSTASMSPSPRPQPDWSEIHQELKGKGVTLQLLWDEYKVVHPDGYQYSRFCELYGDWRGRLDLSMRQHHPAGEKLFVDYCGQTVPITDPATGAIHEAEVFVAVLGASNYTYAEATRSQGLTDWIGSHIRTLEFLDGCPELFVPDNLKSGVNKPCRYEPELNPTYRDLATHYGMAIIPARVRKPKDKAKVEVGVQVVERWILACLRHRQFFSLSELNTAIRELLERLNNKPFRKLAGSRRSQFEALDKPALKPLPRERFEVAEWAKVRVGPDYHIEVEGHFYSVPYQLVRQELEARFTGQTVECLHRGQRVACHVRSYAQGQCTTVLEHQPPEHRHHAEWTPQKLVTWAHDNGPATAQVVEAILTSRPHPHQGFHSCLGLRSLAKHYGPERLEAASERALAIHGLSYKSIRSMLKNGLDQQPLPGTAPSAQTIEHGNVRGAAYYRSPLQEADPC